MRICVYDLAKEKIKMLLSGILLALPHVASWATRASPPVVVRPRAHATQMGLFDFFASEPEQVSLQKGFAAVSHILLCGAEAGEQAEALKARIDSGDISFEDAAVQFSQCRSKGKLGNLGACKSAKRFNPCCLSLYDHRPMFESRG